MQSKADKNLKSKGKKKETNLNSINQARNKSAKCKNSFKNLNKFCYRLKEIKNLFKFHLLSRMIKILIINIKSLKIPYFKNY